jgi:hypothetical protein
MEGVFFFATLKKARRMKKEYEHGDIACKSRYGKG